MPPNKSVNSRRKRVGVVFYPRRREPSTAAKPEVVARLLVEPEARCSAPGELGSRPAS